jgi:hypothetical protein
MRLRIAETGETGTVITHEPGGDCLMRLDDGTPRVVGPREIVQLLLPDWGLEPPRTDAQETP